MKDFFEWFIRETKKIIPPKTLALINPLYHYLMALLGALVYGFPSRKIFVVGVTGTKGKTSVIEITNAILEEAGYETAVASTFRFKIGDNSNRNFYRMTMPGRFSLQKFLRRAVREKCKYAIIEMTSQGALQHRHEFIYLDALIFTNIYPEHIESHGSYENYLNSKLQLKNSLEKSYKDPSYIVVNRDDKEAEKFLRGDIERKITYGLSDAQPFSVKEDSSEFTWRGEKIKTTLPGEFNVYNIMAGAVFAETQNIDVKIVKKAMDRLKFIYGRMEKIKLEDFSDFEIIVDYAHTPDSLKKVYETLRNREKICVFGGAGGGRDKWKRPVMGQIAAEYCKEIVLTNVDPYDEDPMAIAQDVKKGVDEKNKELGDTAVPCEIILDRRKAIRHAINSAKNGSVIIITGKGTDPYIIGKEGAKTPWDDAAVAREELTSFISKE